MILQNLLEEIKDVDGFRRFSEFLHDGRKQLNLYGLSGASSAMAIAHAVKKLGKTALVIAPDLEEAEKLHDDLAAFLGRDLVRLFPSWGISPYEIRAPHTEVIGRRLMTLYDLLESRDKDAYNPSVVVAPVKAIMEPTITSDDLLANSLLIKKGAQIERDDLVALLTRLNYQRSPVTEMLGEYSVRGGLIDLFTPYDEDPVRIEFFGDEIESIRHFSVLSQRSTKQVPSTFILPRRELVFDHEIIDIYTEILDETQAQALHIALGNNSDYDGIEFMWPNMNLKMADIFGYLPDDTLVFSLDADACLAQVEDILATAQERFDSIDDIPLARPERIYLGRERLSENLSHYRHVDINGTLRDDLAADSIKFNTLPQEFFSTNISYMKDRLREIYHDGFKLTILCENQNQKERIAELLEDIGIAIELEVARLSAGFAIIDLQHWYLVDHQMFTRHKKRRTFRKFREGVSI
jgi:transcription-repair coupling factor (superfamily II helicase)